MGVTTTPALILRHHDDREHDRTIVVLTPEHGLLRLRARGTKKSVSKLAGSLEPLTLSTISFADGRVSGLITGAIIIDRFPAIRADLIAMTSCLWFFELVEHVTRPGLRNQELWAFVQDRLGGLASQVGQPLGQRWLALDVSAFRLLHLEGFMPLPDRCARCQQTLSSNEVAYQPQVGFVHQREAAEHDLRLGEPAVNILLTGQVADSTRTVFREIHQLVAEGIAHTLDRPLRADRVLRSIFRTHGLSANGE